MDLPEEMDEKLREVCCIGQLDSVLNLLSNGADINSQNKINGWTCLHWAAKRGQTAIIPVLLNHGANNKISNFKGETASDVACNEEIRQLLDEHISTNNTNEEHVQNDELTSFAPIQGNNFVPHYLKNRVIPHKKETSRTISDSISCVEERACSVCAANNVLVLKVRNASSDETDFIEVELLQSELTFLKFVQICCSELGISEGAVTKVRKLPNTIIRNDKDVQRLKEFQEIEFFILRSQ